MYEVNAAGSRFAVKLSAQPAPCPVAAPCRCSCSKSSRAAATPRFSGLLTAEAGALALGENAFRLAGEAEAGTYRLLFTLCDPQGTVMASAPFNFILRAEG